MKYGFVIDNRKCIGCHACTVACKSEHDVAIGVNRTWVKQTEKGEFPHSRRVFSVLRCNHCTDAPCVEICPVEALFIREDGIVDFNNDRCIGCKSCMQACPYDSLYIDPKTNTAAKCNYCAHRIDIGLEPACVVVCPEEAIVSGDMENPDSKISELISRQQVSVRKPEKSTKPNLYYVNGDQASLSPQATDRSDQYLWNSQAGGVGHYAKYAQEKSAGKSYEQLAGQLSGQDNNKKPIEALMGNANAKRVYDTPDKGILWGWEVSGYVATKAVSAGIFLVFFLNKMLGGVAFGQTTLLAGGIAGLVFLMLTGALLIKDLDQPKRFLNVLLRPQWNSWLVRGGYFITLYGGLLTLWVAAIYMDWHALADISFYITAFVAVLVAIYTAFLFAQAKGRDFWQSPALALHMVIHSLMGGAAFIMLWQTMAGENTGLSYHILAVSLAINLIVVFIELFMPHPTEDAKRVAGMILSGRYKVQFWLVTVFIGNVIPLALYFTGIPVLLPVAAVLSLIGLYYANKIWIEAPQRISLT